MNPEKMEKCWLSKREKLFRGQMSLELMILIHILTDSSDEVMDQATEVFTLNYAGPHLLIPLSTVPCKQEELIMG